MRVGRVLRRPELRTPSARPVQHHTGRPMTTTAPDLTSGTTPSTPCAHYGWAVLALAMGGFAIGTTEFVSMGLLPDLADGVVRLDPDRGPRHLGVRPRGRRRRSGHRAARRPAAASGPAHRADGRVRIGQRRQRPGHVVRRPARRPLRRRPAARRLLRRRLAGRGQPREARPPGPRRRAGHARPLGRQRGRGARRHLARPAARLALGVLAGGRARPGHRRPGRRVRAVDASATRTPRGAGRSAPCGGRRCC